MTDQAKNGFLLAGGLFALAMLALSLRAWLGGTSLDQLDPTSLAISLTFAVGFFVPASRALRAEEADG